MNWIKSNPIIAGIAAAVILAIAIAFISGWFSFKDRAAERHDNAVKTTGTLDERLKSNEETFDAVRNAQQPITRDELNVVCSRFDRNCPTSRNP